jgi:hypothetical protein
LDADGPASERQSEANRLNAQGSTFSRTEEGKAQRSQNALIHGLTAPGEFLRVRIPKSLTA